MKKDKNTSTEEIEENEEYLMPDDCEQSEQEIESISIDERKTHYQLINLFAIAITALVAAAVFLLLTGEKKPMVVDNPLTLKTFMSGDYTKKLENSYIKALPYQYEFKNGNERLSYLYGIGNHIKKYKDVDDGIVIVSDEEIEKKKISNRQNEEQAIDIHTKEVDSQPETTKPKATTKKQTKTNSQSLTTTTRLTTATTTTTTEQTTRLTTTNNEAPVVNTTTTVPPAVTYNYDSIPEESEIGEEESQE